MGVVELVTVGAMGDLSLAHQLLYSAVGALEQLDGAAQVPVASAVELLGLQLDRVVLVVDVPLHCEVACPLGVALPVVGVRGWQGQRRLE